MIINRNFFVLFGISFLVYLLPELIAGDAMLYIVGGLVGAPLQEIISFFGENASDYFVLILWGISLIGFTCLFFSAKNRVFSYLVFFIIGLLLYIVDLGLYGMVSYDPEIKGKIILNSYIKAIPFVLISVLIKSLVLSVIYYKRKKPTRAKWKA